MAPHCPLYIQVHTPWPGVQKTLPPPPWCMPRTVLSLVCTRYFLHSPHPPTHHASHCLPLAASSSCPGITCSSTFLHLPSLGRVRLLDAPTQIPGHPIKCTTCNCLFEGLISLWIEFLEDRWRILIATVSPASGTMPSKQVITTTTIVMATIY